MIQQTGEYSSFNDPKTNLLKPMLALSFTPNTDASVWTYTAPPGRHVHRRQPDDGRRRRLQLPAELRPEGVRERGVGVHRCARQDGVKKIDDQTVEFNLEAPNGNFPYLISSDNYNMIIVQNGTD